MIAACAFWLGWAVPSLSGLGYGQPSGALYEDEVLVAVVGYLYRGTYDSVRAGVQLPRRCANFTFFGRSATQAKLDIRGDRLLLLQAGGVNTIVPMVDLQLLEWSQLAEKLCRLRGHKSQWDFVNEHTNTDPTLLLFPRHRKPDVPQPRPHGLGNGQGLGIIPEWSYTQAARYDLQIAGPKSVRLFHAHQDTLFVSIEFDYLLNWYRGEMNRITLGTVNPPERELRTGKLPADFTEHFAVYTADKRDYLVTPNGKVYLCVPKGKTEVEVSAVWAEPKRKVVGVVQDQANDAVYGWGFVTDSAAPERFYVKFEPKPVAVEYKRTVPLWGDRSDAYLENYECARAFRKAAEKK